MDTVKYTDTARLLISTNTDTITMYINVTMLVQSSSNSTERLIINLEANKLTHTGIH